MLFKIVLKSAGWFPFQAFQTLGLKTCYGQLQSMIIRFKTIPTQQMQLFIYLQKVRMQIN